MTDFGQSRPLPAGVAALATEGSISRTQPFNAEHVLIQYVSSNKRRGVDEYEPTSYSNGDADEMVADSAFKIMEE